MKTTRRKTWGAALLTGVTLWAGLTGGVVLGHRLLAEPTAPVTPAPAIEVVEVELPVRPPIEGLPACPTEDSVGPCNWYGGSNGEGLKFAALPERGQPVPDGMAADLDAESPGRDWGVCTWYVGDTSWIVCPDGYALSS